MSMLDGSKLHGGLLATRVAQLEGKPIAFQLYFQHPPTNYISNLTTIPHGSFLQLEEENFYIVELEFWVHLVSFVVEKG